MGTQTVWPLQLVFVTLLLLVPNQDIPSDPSLAQMTASDFIGSKYQLAQRHFELKQYQMAYRLCDSILLLCPDLSYRDRVKRLRRVARAKELSTSVLSVAFEPNPIGEFPYSRIRGNVAAESLSDEQISIRVEDSGVFGILEHQLIEIYEDGSHRSTQGRTVIRNAQDLELDPGERAEVEVEVELVRGTRAPVLQYFRINGEVRTQQILEGEQALDRPVPFEPYEAIVLDPKLEGVKEDLLGSLDSGLENAQLDRAAAAGFYLIYDINLREQDRRVRRDQLIEVLINCLKEDRPLAVHSLTMRLLESSTGEKLGLIVARWLEWDQLRRRR